MLTQCGLADTVRGPTNWSTSVADLFAYLWQRYQSPVVMRCALGRIIARAADRHHVPGTNQYRLIDMYPLQHAQAYSNFPQMGCP